MKREDVLKAYHDFSGQTNADGVFLLAALKINIISVDFDHRKNIINGFYDAGWFLQNAAGFVVQKMAELQATFLSAVQRPHRFLKIDFSQAVVDVFLFQPVEKRIQVE